MRIRRIQFRIRIPNTGQWRYGTSCYNVNDGVCREDVQRGCAQEGAGGGGREVHRKPAQVDPPYFKQKYFLLNYA